MADRLPLSALPCLWLLAGVGVEAEAARRRPRDAVAGSTVTVYSVANGNQIGSATTDANGSYSVAVPTSSVGDGIRLQSSGGTMNGATFDGTLSAIYPKSASTSAVNLNLLTTSLVKAADTTAVFSGTVLEKHESIKATALARGLIAQDYNAATPIASTNNAALQKLVSVQGVDTTTSNFADQFNVFANLTPSCPGNSSPCIRDFPSGNTTEQTMRTAKATLTIPAGALTGPCSVLLEDYSPYASRVTIGNMVSGASGAIVAVSNCTVNNASRLVIELASSVAVNNECIPPAQRSTVFSGNSNIGGFCLTPGAGLDPGYYVSDSGSKFNVHSGSYSFAPNVGGSVEVERSYHANLFSDQAASTTAANQWAGKQAIVYVHGYQNSPSASGFGGGGTWGYLPSLLKNGSATVVNLNFQWRTSASFYDVAQDLASAVDYAYASTGQKVYVVAHSFGGLLARTMLQDLGVAVGKPSRATSASRVAKLVTVGSPHSGILFSAGTVETQALPAGRDLPALAAIGISGCEQITCYQAGVDVSAGPWKTYLESDRLGGVALQAGYIPARLAQTTANWPTGLEALVLMGLSKNAALSSFGTGDNLISYLGQRFSPQTGRNALLNQSVIGGGTVTEQVLGLPRTVNGFPGDPLSAAASVSAFYKNHQGYKHASGMSGAGTPEVGIANDADCPASDACQHDTYLNIRSFFFGEVQASTGPYAVYEAISLWVRNLLSTVKSVVFSFGDNLANQIAAVTNGVSATITQAFSSAGNKTVTATFKDGTSGGGNTVGSATLALTVAAGTVGQTATITSVQNNNVTPATAIASGSTTTDATPYLSGTVSAALSQSYTVRIYNGTTLLGTANLDSARTGWTWQSITLSNATYNLQAVVARADGVEGTKSSAWVITVHVSTTQSNNKLNDTGITTSQCYQAGSDTLVSCASSAAISLNNAQDGMIGRDAQAAAGTLAKTGIGSKGFDFTKINASGQVLPNNNAGWCAVKDNVTGLVWEDKRADGSIYDGTRTFTNYGDGRSGDASALVAQANADALCGFTDWRLPTVDELQSLVDYGIASPGPTIDTSLFHYTQNGLYWTASPYVGNSYNAWDVYFGNGYVNDSNRGYSHYVRLVRASQ